MAHAYRFQGDLYCKACGEVLKTGLKPNKDSERFPLGPCADGGGEADCPQHCAECGAFLENPLTEEGYCYLRREFHLNNGNTELLRIWRKFYSAQSAPRKGIASPSHGVSWLIASWGGLAEKFAGFAFTAGGHPPALR